MLDLTDMQCDNWRLLQVLHRFACLLVSEWSVILVVSAFNHGTATSYGEYGCVSGPSESLIPMHKLINLTYSHEKTMDCILYGAISDWLVQPSTNALWTGTRWHLTDGLVFSTRTSTTFSSNYDSYRYRCLLSEVWTIPRLHPQSVQ